jgi:thiamine biosynthesis lipoprotein
MRKTFVWVSLFLIVLLIGVGAWRLTDNREASRAEFLMGTYMEIKAFGRQAPTALEKAFARIREIEERMTQNTLDSEIAAINQKAGSEAVKVSEDTFFVIEKALEYGRLTGGMFDPTIQPVVRLWQIGSPEARVPSTAEIEAKLPLVDYRAVQLDATQKKVYLPHAGMGLDLGGIAKGYAADETVAILKAHGVKKALINLGGNIYALGTNPNNEPWKIGIQDPEDQRNQYIAIIAAQDATLVTSGPYERFLKVDDTVYHHILNPTTGYPADTGLLSVTIVASKSIDADALSTSVFALGREAGLDLINSLENVEAVVIDDQYRVYTTAGIRERFTLTDPKYTLMP